MKTEASAQRTTGKPPPSAVQHRTVNGKRMVLLEESEYERLRGKADEWEPLMPPPDAKGNFPALEALRVSLARKIIRQRRRVGLTQAELARRAGIRPETLNRIEHARHSPSVPTVAKIEQALQAAEAENK